MHTTTGPEMCQFCGRKGDGATGCGECRAIATNAVGDACALMAETSSGRQLLFSQRQMIANAVMRAMVKQLKKSISP